MVDIDRLNRAIEESGMTIKAVAKRAGIPRYTLDRRLKGVGDFTAAEIVGLTKALRLKVSERNDIFLRESVNDIHDTKVQTNETL